MLSLMATHHYNREYMFELKEKARGEIPGITLEEVFSNLTRTLCPAIGIEARVLWPGHFHWLLSNDIGNIFEIDKIDGRFIALLYLMIKQCPPPAREIKLTLYYMDEENPGDILSKEVTDIYEFLKTTETKDRPENRDYSKLCHEEYEEFIKRRSNK